MVYPPIVNEPCLYFSIALCKISHSHRAAHPCLFYKSRVHPCLIMNHPPSQVIHPKHRLPQSLLRITSRKSHHSLQLPQSMLHHPSFFQRSIPSVILPKFPPFIIFSNNFFPSLSFGSKNIQGHTASQCHQSKSIQLIFTPDSMIHSGYRFTDYFFWIR